jgi:hypothetical protein
MYRDIPSDGGSGLAGSISERIERRIRDITYDTLTGKIFEVLGITGEYVPVDQRPKCLPQDYEVLMLPSGAMLSVYYLENKEQGTNSVRFSYLSAPNVDQNHLQSVFLSIMAVTCWEILMQPIPFEEEKDRTQRHLFLIQGELDSQSGAPGTIENIRYLRNLQGLLNYFKDSQKPVKDV